MAKAAEAVQLSESTLAAFVSYVEQAETEAAKERAGGGAFLWSDREGGRAALVAAGKTIADYWTGSRPVKVPDGLIHDWVGAARAPGGTIARTLAVLQDYDHHKDVYHPEVVDSRLIRREGDAFDAYLRLLKKKVVTVVLDTEHHAEYYAVGPARSCCDSHSTRISEVEDAGKGSEMVRPPDTGYGFLWRLNSYWHFEERDGGVIIECRAISLTREVPKGLRWIVEPIVKKLPRESLIHTLDATRTAVLA